MELYSVYSSNQIKRKISCSTIKIPTAFLKESMNEQYILKTKMKKKLDKWIISQIDLNSKIFEKARSIANKIDLKSKSNKEYKIMINSNKIQRRSLSNIDKNKKNVVENLMKPSQEVQEKIDFAEKI